MEDVVWEEEEGEEGRSQRSSNRPMAASVDPEIHTNLKEVSSPFDACCQSSVRSQGIHQFQNPGENKS